ncbi:MAG: hypothetical protein HY883_06855 [Deltaproteobacteria bacterium]|nr:hypothetical protein [Deltaproteobacteria bacterium]
MRKISLIALTCMTAVTMAGCATFETETSGRLVDEVKLGEIQPGKTQKGEILATFGDPTEVKKEDGAEKLYYIYRESRVPRYLGGLIEDKSRAGVKETILEITIKDNTVTNYKFERTEEEED